MAREKAEVEVRICDFCGYRSIPHSSFHMKVDECIKCGRDFCPRCGDFGKDKQFVCKECKEIG